jgi:RimJ/RimL family protein N-acetyltransferase
LTVYLRKAEPSDLPDILAIIEDGRRTLQKSGIPQWQNGDGPNQEILAKDIDQQTCYILMVEDTLAGVGVLCSEIDPAYEAIFNGSWQPHSQATYTAIHRVALKSFFQGQGLALVLLRSLVTAARLQGATDIRIDTHPQNLAMQHLIKKAGFVYQGDVILDVNDGERYAYQMILK